MAIRDADGMALDNSSDTTIGGVRTIRTVTQLEEVIQQEECQGMLKTLRPDGTITVEPIPPKPRRPLKHGEVIGPDGNIWHNGKFVHDVEEIEKDRSRQDETAAAEAATLALETANLTPTERMQGVRRIGSTKRDRDGKLLEVSGVRVPNRNRGDSYEPGLQPGLRWPNWPASDNKENQGRIV